MSFVAGLLTAVLVLDSLFLILLILVQLPKKEAGVGQAFGGGATDALFGAGTGNALTKMTKYAATIFLALSLVLYVMGSQARKSGSGVREQLKKDGAASVLPPAKTTPPTASPVPAIVPPPASILTNVVTTNLPVATNAVAPKVTISSNTPPPVKNAPSTNAPAKK
ncbi:MAG: preprotein translocase subunit SecG [Verrucomicrobia bacterium]|nr:preprotein translocase subunit SecG [Verrucomicrobiota bacterium]